MCYVSVGFSCFPLFHHDSSFCFCFGTSTSAGSRAENRTETCYDLARVFLDLGLDEHRLGSRSGSGCLCDAPCEAGFVSVTKIACPSQMTRMICRASASRASDFEKTNNDGVWAQANPYRKTASVCGGGSCSLWAMETAIFCVYREPGTRSCVSSVCDCRTHWMSGTENGAVVSPSRAIVAA